MPVRSDSRSWRAEPISHSTQPVSRTRRAGAPGASVSRSRLWRSGASASTTTCSSVSTAPKRWPISLQPWPWRTRRGPPPSSVRPIQRARPSCCGSTSSRPSDGGSSSASFDQAVIMCMRLLPAQTCPPPASDTSVPKPGLASTLIHGRDGWRCASTSKANAPVSVSNRPSGGSAAAAGAAPDAGGSRSASGQAGCSRRWRSCCARRAVQRCICWPSVRLSACRCRRASVCSVNSSSSVSAARASACSVERRTAGSAGSCCA